jgi:hypothetical protein
MPEVLIETSFLIPLHEDKDIGNGKFHPSDRWNKFKMKLYESFNAWTLAPGAYEGCYKDPDTEEIVMDLSRKFIIAIPENDLNRLKDFLITEGAEFKQKYIYFEAGGNVELLEVRHEKNI